MNSKTIDTWHQIVATKDLKKLDELLNNEVVFHSPVVHTPQVGKEITAQYLTAAFDVFFNETFRYTAQTQNANQAVLEFEVELDGILVNGVDIITWNDDQKIVAFKVMVRPLKGVNAVHQLMMQRLTQQ